MERFTTKYLIASIALLGICLGLHQSPYLNNDSWPMHLTASILGISTLVHLAATLLRLKSFWRWLFAGVVPTAAIIAWYIYGVKTGNRHPGSIGVYGFLVGGLFWFPIGFAIVNCLMFAVDRFGRTERLADTVG